MSRPIDFSMPAPAPAIPAPSPAPKQQCWECLRRRWVCDAATPVCNKCRAAGIVCPGYSDRKPLIWLAPGRVTSRNRRQRTTKTTEKSATGQRVAEAAADKSTDKGKVTRKASTKAQANKTRTRSNSAANTNTNVEHGFASTATTTSCSSSSTPTHNPATAAINTGTTGDMSFTLAVRSSNQSDGRIAELPEYWPPEWTDQWSMDSAPAEGRSAQVSKEWLEGLSWELARDRTMYKQQGNTIYVPPALRLEICDFFEAATYYNEHIYPPLAANQLTPNPFVAPFVALEYMPPSIRHSLISMVISYRILEMPRSESLGTSLARVGPGPVTGPAARLWWRLHHHMGLAIRYLNEDISSDETRCSDVTLAGVYIFLIAELHHSLSPHWRVHVDGFLSLIALRGGLAKVLENSPHIRISMLSFFVICIITNTTGSPETQIAGSQHFELIDAVAALYSSCIFPTLPCPLPLFLNIIRINHVRHQVAVDSSAIFGESTLAQSRAILDDVFAFSPESWTASLNFPARKEILLVARLFKCSVALYAMSTLPSQPYNDLSTCSSPNSSLEYSTRTKSYQYSHLMELLEEAAGAPVLERSLIWPMIVAGVIAAGGTQTERDFVERNLSKMANATGGYLLVAKWTLERFWVTGKSNWNDCFQKQTVLLC